MFSGLSPENIFWLLAGKNAVAVLLTNVFRSLSGKHFSIRSRKKAALPIHSASDTCIHPFHRVFSKLNSKQIDSLKRLCKKFIVGGFSAESVEQLLQLAGSACGVKFSLPNSDRETNPREVVFLKDLLHLVVRSPSVLSTGSGIIENADNFWTNMETMVGADPTTTNGQSTQKINVSLETPCQCNTNETKSFQTAFTFDKPDFKLTADRNSPPVRGGGLRVNNVCLSLAVSALFTHMGVSASKDSDDKCRLFPRCPCQPPWNNRSLQAARNTHTENIDPTTKEAGLVAACLGLNDLSVSKHPLVVYPCKILHCSDRGSCVDSVDSATGQCSASELASDVQDSKNPVAVSTAVSSCGGRDLTGRSLASTCTREDLNALCKILLDHEIDEICNTAEPWNTLEPDHQALILFATLMQAVTRECSGFKTFKDHAKLCVRLCRKIPLAEILEKPTTCHDLAFRNCVLLHAATPLRVSVTDGSCRVTACLSSMFFTCPETQMEFPEKRNHCVLPLVTAPNDRRWNWSEIASDVGSSEFLCLHEDHVMHTADSNGSDTSSPALLSSSLTLPLQEHSQIAQSRTSTVDTSCIFEVAAAFHQFVIDKNTHCLEEMSGKVIESVQFLTKNQKHLPEIALRCLHDTKNEAGVFVFNLLRLDRTQSRNDFQVSFDAKKEKVLSEIALGRHVSYPKQNIQVVVTLDMLCSILCTPNKDTRIRHAGVAETACNKINSIQCNCGPHTACPRRNGPPSQGNDAPSQNPKSTFIPHGGILHIQENQNGTQDQDPKIVFAAGQHPDPQTLHVSEQHVFLPNQNQRGVTGSPQIDFLSFFTHFFLFSCCCTSRACSSPAKTFPKNRIPLTARSFSFCAGFLSCSHRCNSKILFWTEQCFRQNGRAKVQKRRQWEFDTLPLHVLLCLR